MSTTKKEVTDLEKLRAALARQGINDLVPGKWVSAPEPILHPECIKTGVRFHARASKEFMDHDTQGKFWRVEVGFSPLADPEHAQKMSKYVGVDLQFNGTAVKPRDSGKLYTVRSITDFHGGDAETSLEEAARALWFFEHFYIPLLKEMSQNTKKWPWGIVGYVPEHGDL